MSSSKLSEFFHKHLPNVTADQSDVPFGAKIGSIIRFPLDDVLSSQAANGLSSPPDVELDSVTRIGRLRVEGVGDFYRFFVNDSSHEQKFVQLYKRQNGGLVEAMYFSQIASFVPETSEEQDLFTGANGCGLGDISYDLSKSFLLGNGPLDEIAAFKAFLRDESISFHREGPSQNDFLEPFQGVEIQTTDNNGLHGLQQNVWFSLYQRQLNNGKYENLLISTNVVESMDGDYSKRSINVVFYAGVAIDVNHIFID